MGFIDGAVEIIVAVGENIGYVLIVLTFLAFAGVLLAALQKPADPTNVPNAVKVGVDEATGGILLFSDIVRFLSFNPWLLLAFILILFVWISRGVNPFW